MKIYKQESIFKLGQRKKYNTFKFEQIKGAIYLHIFNVSKNGSKS